MIYLDGQQIDSMAQFSSRFQSVLLMIDDGSEWLEWAIKDNVVPVYAANENDLLLLIQRGLHEDDNIRFNTFRMSIRKLLSMSDDDVEQLAAIRKGPNDNETNLKVLLQRNNMYSYGDIAKTESILAPGVTQRPDLFQAPGFSDLLALTALVQTQQSKDQPLDAPAFSFASALAAGIPDFINLYRFFQYVAINKLPANLVPDMQVSAAESIYKKYLPVVPYLLFTPGIQPGMSEVALKEAVPETARAEKFIGYTMVSAAILNLVQQDKAGQAGQPLQVDQYVTTIKNAVGYTPASAYAVSQDGNAAVLIYKKDKVLAEVGVDNYGNLFLLPGSTTNNES